MPRRGAASIKRERDELLRHEQHGEKHQRIQERKDQLHADIAHHAVERETDEKPDSRAEHPDKQRLVHFAEDAVRLPRQHRERRLRNRRQHAKQHTKEDHEHRFFELWQCAADELARGENAFVQPDEEKRLTHNHAQIAHNQLAVIGWMFQWSDEDADDYDDGGERQR